ncbi:MAG: porphobilinogen synthase [Planctomycetota bacterium]
MNELHLTKRPRRLRASPLLRDMVASASVEPRALIQPHFVIPGQARTEPIPSMPGIARATTDQLLQQVEADLELGITKVLLFAVPEEKDPTARSARAKDGLAPQAIRALKQQFGSDLVVIADVCLCAFTDHGHCGVLHDGEVLNDATLPLLADMALACAEAGVDIVAPSDMMDGRVAAIRQRLDASGMTQVPSMSYAAKFASAFYGPFREAAHSAPKSGDRKSYQLDCRNAREAIRDALLDEDEGADLLMVKPALAYLDILHELRARTLLPLCAYNVSGEYSMVKAAAERGWINEPAIVLETLTAMRRAGTDLIITYHARDALRNRWL